jgi:hypothetical protein
LSAANSGQFSNNNGSNVGPASVNFNDATVTTALNTVNNLSSTLAGLSGTSIAINGNQTINESAGVAHTVAGVEYKVFTVTSYSENDGKVVTINGDGSGDPVVFNFTFNSNVNLGGDVALAGNGLNDDKVIWNFNSANTENISLNNNASSYRTLAFHGIILAPNDKLSLVNANLNGRVFGGNSSDMQIVSGDTIHAPVMNTATVSASNVTFDADDSASASVTIKSATAPQLAAGSTSQAGAGLTELLGAPGSLQAGVIGVAVDLPAGPQSAAEQSAISSALDSLNSQVGQLGLKLVEVSGADADAAQIHIQLAPSTDIGGIDQGVLADWQSDGQITLVDGCNWYFGSNAGGIASGQYDFQTVVTHELGHVLGLGENSDSFSAMSLYLNPGDVRRSLTANDLNAIRQEMGVQSAQSALGDSGSLVPASQFDSQTAAMFDFGNLMAKDWATLIAAGYSNSWIDGASFAESVVPGMELWSAAAYGSNPESVVAALDLLTKMRESGDNPNSDGSHALIGGDGESLVIVGIGRDLVIGGKAYDGSGTPSYGNVLAGETGYSYRDGALLGQLHEWNERNSEANNPDNRIPGAAGESWAGDRSGESLLDFDSSNTPSQFPMQEAIYLGGDLGILDTEGVDGGTED